MHFCKEYQRDRRKHCLPETKSMTLGGGSLTGWDEGSGTKDGRTHERMHAGSGCLIIIRMNARTAGGRVGCATDVGKH